MSKLFICNTTNQNCHRSFRVPEMNRPYFVRIPPGSQVEVDGNLSLESQKAIVTQLERFGGKDASSVKGKLEAFPGIFFRWDKPVPVDDILVGHAAVIDHAEQRAAGAAANSALAFDLAQRDKTGQRLASETEVEVTEEIPRGKRSTGKEVKMKVTVAKDGQDNAKLPRA